MRRSFIFLTGAFVCLLVANFSLAQTSGFDSTQASLAPAAVERVSVTTLSSAEVAQKLAEAKKLLQSHALENTVSVALTAFEPGTSEIHILSIAKDEFLTKGAALSLTSHLGHTMRLRVVRPNGVNTAVNVKDSTGRTLLPLLVKYPITQDGVWTENAYYTSAHPALVSSAVVDEGHRYLATMFAQATSELEASGVHIPADLVEVAKHLVIVEHTDHKRFREEDRAGIYPEVLALYALNRGDTYRYSVSSAGAGGMIQMIPKTYAAIREHHPNVTLEADFVRGMQNHSNALKAMLLYINDTWKHLHGTPEVQQALQSGIASKTELLAAGYNSNPYRLPNYLTNGGSAWRSLIPAETQMYLAIYQSVDSNVTFRNQEPTTSTEVVASTGSSFAASLARHTTAALMSWVGKAILSNTSALTNVIP